MLSEEKTAAYRKKLEDEKSRLMAQIQGADTPDTFGGDAESEEEQQDEVEDFANQLAANHALKERVNEIDAALNRMELGAYGLCEKCNGKVSEEMLAVVPETRLCENCKKK